MLVAQARSALFLASGSCARIPTAISTIFTPRSSPWLRYAMPALTRALTTALTSPTSAISTYFPRLLRRLPAQTYQVLDKAARDGLALQFGPRIYKRRHIHGELPIVHLGLEYALGIVVGISRPGGTIVVSESNAPAI